MLRHRRGSTIRLRAAPILAAELNKLTIEQIVLRRSCLTSRSSSVALRFDHPFLFLRPLLSLVSLLSYRTIDIFLGAYIVVLPSGIHDIPGSARFRLQTSLAWPSALFAILIIAVPSSQLVTYT